MKEEGQVTWPSVHVSTDQNENDFTRHVIRGTNQGGSRDSLNCLYVELVAGWCAKLGLCQSKVETAQVGAQSRRWRRSRDSSGDQSANWQIKFELSELAVSRNSADLFFCFFFVFEENFRTRDSPFLWSITWLARTNQPPPGIALRRWLLSWLFITKGVSMKGGIGLFLFVNERRATKVDSLIGLIPWNKNEPIG